MAKKVTSLPTFRAKPCCCRNSPGATLSLLVQARCRTWTQIEFRAERAALRYVLGNSDARAEFIRALNQGVTEATLHELDSIRSALFPG